MGRERDAGAVKKDAGNLVGNRKQLGGNRSRGKELATWWVTGLKSLKFKSWLVYLPIIDLHF